MWVEANSTRWAIVISEIAVAKFKSGGFHVPRFYINGPEHAQVFVLWSHPNLGLYRVPTSKFYCRVAILAHVNGEHLVVNKSLSTKLIHKVSILILFLAASVWCQAQIAIKLTIETYRRSVIWWNHRVKSCFSMILGQLHGETVFHYSLPKLRLPQVIFSIKRDISLSILMWVPSSSRRLVLMLNMTVPAPLSYQSDVLLFGWKLEFVGVLTAVEIHVLSAEIIPSEVGSQVNVEEPALGRR